MTFVPVRPGSQTDRLAVSSLALVLVALIAEVLGLVVPLPVPAALTNAALLAALVLAGWTVARRSRRGLRLRRAAKAALALILLRLVVLAGLLASFVFGPGFS